MSASKYFLDTNIFVYSFDEKDPIKRQKARTIIREALKSQTGVISFQVIQEFLNLATKKFSVALSFEDLNDYLRTVLFPLCDTSPTEDLYQYALELHRAHHFSFYDSLILAAAAKNNCKMIYTEDLQEGQVVAGVKIQNPFAR